MPKRLKIIKDIGLCLQSKPKNRKIKNICNEISKNKITKNISSCSTGQQMTLDNINMRINKECCKKTINMLDDESLIDEYKKCKSVKNEINKLEKILIDNNIDSSKINAIINEYLYELVPPGTKGVCRGIEFNKIVKNTIEKLNLDKDIFEVEFEKKCPYVETTEIPDWYITEISTKKTLIGMNQIDLWSGGQQINRGYKYLIDNRINSDNTKLLCVVCSEIIFKNDKNKAYKLFEVGFSNNTLCYLNNSEKIINEYFAHK